MTSCIFNPAQTTIACTLKNLYFGTPLPLDIKSETNCLFRGFWINRGFVCYKQNSTPNKISALEFLAKAEESRISLGYLTYDAKHLKGYDFDEESAFGKSMHFPLLSNILTINKDFIDVTTQDQFVHAFLHLDELWTECGEYTPTNMLNIINFFVYQLVKERDYREHRGYLHDPHHISLPIRIPLTPEEKAQIIRDLTVSDTDTDFTAHSGIAGYHNNEDGISYNAKGASHKEARKAFTRPHITTKRAPITRPYIYEPSFDVPPQKQKENTDTSVLPEQTTPKSDAGETQPKIRKTAEQRKQHYTQSTLRSEKSDYIERDALLKLSAARRLANKQKAREEFIRRQHRKADVPVQWSNPLFQPELTLEARLHGYNKHNKCKHRLRYNKIIKHETRFQFDCDHQKEVSTEPLDKEVCKNCLSPRLHTRIIRSECLCSVKRCSWCLFDTYTCDDKDQIRCHCGYRNATAEIQQHVQRTTKNKVNPWKTNIDRANFMRDLKKNYKPVPKQLPPIKEKEIVVLPPPEVAEEAKPHPSRVTRIDRTKTKLSLDYDITVHGGVASTTATTIATTAKQLISDIMEKIANAFQAVKDAFKVKIRQIANRAVYDAFSKFFNDLLTKVTEICHSVCLWLENNIGMLPAVYVVIRDFFTTTSFANTIAFLGVFGCLAPAVVNQLKELFDWLIHPAFSAHGKFSDIPDGFVSMATSLSRALNLKVNIKYFWDCLRNFNTAVSSYRNVGQILSHFLENLPSFFKAAVRSVDTNIMIAHELKKKDSPYTKLSAASLAITMAKNAEATDADLLRLKLNFADKRKELLEHMEKMGIPYDPHSIRFIDTLAKAAMMSGRIGKDLEETFIIRISGSAGTGKSTIATSLLGCVDPTLTKKEIESKTFFRNPTVEYWDGCTPEKIFCVYDEFGQDRKEEDLKEAMSLISRNPYSPPFSSNSPEDGEFMGFKGQIVNFKAMVLCSNVDELHTITMNSNEAVNRRKHVMFKFTWRTTDRTPKSDFSHLTVHRLNCIQGKGDYTSMWSDHGMDGITRMMRETSTAYKEFRDRIDVTAGVLDRLFEARAEAMAIPSTKGTPIPASVPGNATQPSTSFNAHGGSDLMTAAVQSLILGATFGACSGYDSWLELATNTVCMAVAVGGARATFYTVCEFVRSFIDADWTKRLAMAVGAIGACFLLAEGLARILGFRNHSGENKDGNVMTRVTRARDFNTHNGVEDLEKLFQNQVCTLQVGKNFTNGVFIKGRFALFNNHLFINPDESDSILVPEGTKCILSLPNVKEPFYFDFKTTDFYPIEGEDLCIYHFPKQVQAKPTILRHLWHGDIDLTNRNVMSLVANKGRASTRHGKVLKDQVAAHSQMRVNGKMMRHYNHSLCITNIPSNFGECGSPIIALDNLMQRRFIGVNVGGTQEKSHVLLVTHDMLDNHIRAIEAQLADPNFERLEPFAAHASWRFPTPKELDDCPIQGNIAVHAITERTMVPMTKSKIVPSPLFDKIEEHITEPCNLRLPGKMTENMNKYAHPADDFEQELLDEAFASIKEEIMAVPTVRVHDTLTLEEAINGIPEMPYIDGLDMTTSAGFPFNYDGVQGPKKQLFDYNEAEDKYVPKSVLARQLEIFEDRISNGILPDFPYTNTLKDERKPIYDVNNGKVRMFSMNNTPLAILMRQYLLPTIAHCYQARESTFLCIGMDKSSREWDTFVRRMLEVGNEFYDADYKQFDTRASLSVRRTVNKIFITDNMPDRVKFIIQCLLEYDSQAAHQFYNMILLLSSGTSSGSVLTALINSLINEMYMRLCWLIIFNGTPLRDLSNYRRLVRTKNYGDDLVFTVDKAVSRVFNDESIANVLASYNITMTPGNKHGSWGAKTVNEFTFLKNTTREWDGIYVPLMSNYAEPINWIKTGTRCASPEVACEANCNSALRAAFFHGSDAFNALRNKILAHRPEYNLIGFTSLWREWKMHGSIEDVDGTFSFGKHQTSIDKLMTSYF
jgi:hypothetical protein